MYAGKFIMGAILLAAVVFILACVKMASVYDKEVGDECDEL